MHSPGFRLLTCLALVGGLLGGASLAARAQPAPPQRPELALQVGHVNDIGAVTFSPDGSRLLTVSRDQTAKLWDARDLQLLQTLPGHAGTVLAAAFGPGGEAVFTLDARGTVRSWNAATGSLEGSQETAARSITAGALHPSAGGVLIVAADEGGPGRLWKARADLAAKPEALAALSGHQKPVRAAAFSRDGKWLATGDDEGALRTWDAADGALQRGLKAHAMPIHGLAFSPDGTLLLDGSFDGFAFLWDLKTGKRIAQMQMNRPEDGIASVAFAATGGLVALGGHGGRDRSESVRLWETKTPKEVRILASPGGYVTAVDFSPDGKRLASAGRNNSLRVWDVQTGRVMATGGALDAVQAVALAPGGAVLAGGSRDGAVRLWDPRSGALLAAFSAHEGGVASVAFSPDGLVLVSGGRDGRVRLWNPRTLKEERALEAKAGPVQAVTFSPNGKLVAGGHGESSVDGTLVVWEAATGKVVHTLTGSMGAVRSVAFSPDGNEIATGSGVTGGEVRFWNAKTGEMVARDFFRAVRAVAYSPDGKRLATASTRFAPASEIAREAKPIADEIRLWNAQTHAEQSVLSLPGDGAGILSLAFLADGITLAAGHRDGSVRLWNVRTGEPLRVLRAHLAGAAALAAGEADLLISSGLDNSIRIWSAGMGRLKATFLPLPAGRRGQDPGDWVTATPEGYYHGSPGAGRYVRWRVGPDVFPVEAYEEKLRSPEAVKRLLESMPGMPPPGNPAGDLAQLAPPEVRFISPLEASPVDGPLLKVSLVATDDRKVERVEVTVNGRAVNAKPLFLGAKPLVLGAKPLVLGAKPVPAAHRTEATYELSVPLPPGEARVSLRAVAYDEEGLAGWDQVEVRPRNPEGGLGDLHVLAVGVSEYRNATLNLKYAARDAQAFATLWTASQGKLYGRIRVTELTDREATAANLRFALEGLAEKATRLDSIAVFLSGHGVRTGPGEFYFATHDIDSANQERIQATGLSWKDLQRVLSEARARRVSLFLDACHSGNAMGDRAADNEILAEVVVKRSGALVFASSRGSQYSYELDALRHGAFTAALVEAIGQGKADLELGGTRDGRIDVDELLTYLRARVARLTDNRQTPSCPLLTDFGEPFPLATAP